MDPELSKFDNPTILESIETEANAPMVEHISRKILFIGGIQNLIVLDLPSKSLIARFKFQGDVKSISLPKLDEDGIHILCKVFNQEDECFENHFNHITFQSRFFRRLKNKKIKNIKAFCLDTFSNESLYVVGDGGSSIYKYN